MHENVRASGHQQLHPGKACSGERVGQICAAVHPDSEAGGYTLARLTARLISQDGPMLVAKTG